MSKEKRSMDEVLASIRRIIKTDAPAPGAAIRPESEDETAESVLSKLRGDQAEEELGKPLSRSDDPDETARAVLDELRRQTAAGKGGDPDGSGTTPPRTDAPPDLDRPLNQPPKVRTDQDYVPRFQEVSDEDSLVLRPEGAGSRKAEPALSIAMDEQALEAMIRRVVRDELTGDMGKRLTKNVQKLIQAEIAKAQLPRK